MRSAPAMMCSLLESSGKRANSPASANVATVLLWTPWPVSSRPPAGWRPWPPRWLPSVMGPWPRLPPSAMVCRALPAPAVGPVRRVPPGGPVPECGAAPPLPRRPASSRGKWSRTAGAETGAEPGKGHDVSGAAGRHHFSQEGAHRGRRSHVGCRRGRRVLDPEQKRLREAEKAAATSRTASERERGGGGREQVQARPPRLQTAVF